MAKKEKRTIKIQNGIYNEESNQGIQVGGNVNNYSGKRNQSLITSPNLQYHPAKSSFDVKQIKQILSLHFNINELHDLCFDLCIDYEDLSGTTKSEKIRELLLFVIRHNLTDQLIDEVIDLRPNLF